MARQTKSQRMRLFSELLEDRLTPAKMLGLTPGNSLLQFDSATPGTTTSIAISNLNAGETVLGIDFRPADGKLYAVTDANRLLTINHQTGAATLVGPLTADPTDATSPFTTLDSGVLGFDFNPVADRLRIVTNAGSNLRINPANALVITDGAVNPAGFSIGASAYTNNFAGATATTLFNLDITGDRLTIQNPPNNGTLSVVGTTLGAGIAVANSSGFDIVTTGGPTVTNTAFAVLTQGGDATLFTVDLSTGTATSQGVIGSGAALNGLAAGPAGTCQFSASNFTINEQGGFATITVTRTGGSDGTVVLDLTTTGLTATAGADFASLGTLPMVFSDGDTSLSVSVNIFDDLVPESVETVRLSLAANSANALIGPGGTAFLNIRDNETPPALMYAVDSNNKSILTFDAADPGTILNNAAISNVISKAISYPG
jgi:hypothetical protein